MPDLNQDHLQQQQQQQQRQQPTQQSAQQQQQGAVAAIAAALRRRPSATELSTLIRQLQAQGQIGPDELAQIRDLVSRSAGADYAREVFARFGPAAATTVKKPVTLQEFRDAGLVRRDFAPGQTSMALFRALDKWWADKETIWRLLEPCNRNELDFLRRSYQTVYGRDLLGHLKDKLSGADLRRAYAPFGRASEVGETTGEWMSRKTGEATQWVGDKAGQVKKGAEDLIQKEKDGLAVLADMASIIKDLGLNPLTGEGTVTIDAGKAYYYLAPHLPPHIASMLNVDPAQAGANKVRLYVNLKEKRASLHANALAVRGMNYPNFFSSACALNNLDVQVDRFDPLHPAASGSQGTATIASASLMNAVFTPRPLGQGQLKASQVVSARQVELGGLRLNASNVAKTGTGGPADGIVSQLSFDSARVLGLAYPGLPPVDLELKQAGLNFESLWDTLGQNGPEQSGGRDLPRAPSVLPDGSRIQMQLNGLFGAASLQKGQQGAGAQAAGRGGFASCRIAVVKEGKELAALDIKGFEAHATAAGELGGSVQTLNVTGDPALVRSLLDARELQATPQVKQAVDLIRRFGVEATVGGRATLSNVSFDHAKGQDKVRGDVAASLVIPEVGTVELALRGVAGNRAANGDASLDFDRFEARLRDKASGEVASFLIEGARPGDPAVEADTSQGKTTLAAKRISVAGNSAGLATLFSSLRSKVGSLPPAMQSVFDLVQKHGGALAASGGMQLSNVAVKTGEGGRVSAAGELSGRIDVPGVGTVELGVRGLDVQSGGKGGTDVDFSRFEAKLISAKTKGEAAALVVEGDAASREAKVGAGGKSVGAKKARLSGNTRNLAALLQAIEGKIGSLPQLQPVFASAKAYLPALQQLDAAGDLTVSGMTLAQGADGKLQARGDLTGKIAAPGVGTISLTVKGYRGNPADPSDLHFDSFEATLADTKGAEAARFAVSGVKDGSDRPYFGEAKGHQALSADKIEVRGSSKNLASLLGGLEQKLTSLPAGLRTAFDIAKQYGPSLDAGGSVALTSAALDVTDGKADLRGNCQASINVPDVGSVAVDVKGFEIGAGVANFERFEARLADKSGKAAASLTVEADANEAQRVALQGGFPQKIKSIRVQGSTAEVARLLRLLDEKGGTLPEPAGRILEQAERFLSSYKAEGTLALEDLAVNQVDNKTNLSFQVPVPENSVLTQALRKGSKISVDLRGYAPPKERSTGSLDGLTVRLLGPDGKQVAGVSAKGLVGGLGGLEGDLKVGSFALEGDGRLLSAALSPELLEKLGPAARDALASLQQLKLQASGGSFAPTEKADGSYAGYQGQFADISLGAGISLSDKNGTLYHCEGAKLTAKAPKVKLDRSFKLQELEAEKISGEGKLTRADGGLTVQGKLSGSRARAVLGPDGKPQSFTIGDIQASGEIDAASAEAQQQATGGPQTKDQKLGAMAELQGKAETGASLLRDAEVHTHTPINPGKYGTGFSQIEVPNGTTLDADLIVRGRQVVAGANGTKVSFSNKLGGPLWIGVGGAYLEQEGSRGALKADLKGLFDVDATKALTGQGSMSLKVGELVREVMEHQRRALEAKSPKDERNAERDKQKAEAELVKNRAEWAEDLADEEQDYAGDRAEVEADRAKWRQKLERKRAEARGEGELAKLADKDREEQADFERQLRKIEAKQGEMKAEMAEKEPRGATAADLVGPRGMDPLKTSGTAKLTLASEGGVDRQVMPGVLLPGKSEVNLSGVASGSGTMNLSADKLGALLYGQKIGAEGLSTGDVQLDQQKGAGKGSSHIQFSSFFLKRLDWEAAPQQGKEQTKK